MSQTNPNNAVENDSASPEAVSAADEMTRYDKLLHLQALFPYGGYDELLAAVDSSESTHESVLRAYEVLNPDIYQYEYLHQEWQRSRDSEQPKSVREAAFSGLAEVLRERADEVFPQSYFPNVSQLSEYNKAVHPFVIDTSDWDEEFLFSDGGSGYRSAAEQLARKLCLSVEEEEERDAAGRSVAGGPALYGLTQRRPRANSTDNSVIRPLAAAEQSGRVDDNGGDEAPVLLESVPDSALTAPVVRWAPDASGVSEEVAQQFQEDIFNVFEGNLFISFDIYRRSSAEGSTPQYPASTAANLVHPAAATSGSAPGAESVAPAVAAAAAAGPSQEHAPDAPAVAIEVETERMNHGDGVVEVLANSATAAPGTQAQSPLALSTNPTVEQALQEQGRRQRKGAPNRLETRLKKVNPLGNMVFHVSPNGSFTSATAAASRTGEPVYEEEPVYYDQELQQQLEYLRGEASRWQRELTLLAPYEHLFNDKNRCHLIGNVYDGCPNFTANVETVLRTLLSIVSREVVGRTLVSPQEELLVTLPLFGRKIVSFGSVRVRSLGFDLDRCFAQFLEEGATATVTVAVQELELEPLDFVYTSEKKAAERMWKTHRQQRDGLVRTESPHGSGGGLSSTQVQSGTAPAAADGVTSGTLNLRAKNVRLQIWGFAYLLASGKYAIIIEKTKIKIGSLKLSTDVGKLNALLTLGKPIIKSIVKREIKSALTRTHLFG